MMSVIEKNIKWIIILFVSTFAVLTIFLSDFSGMSDGFTRVGFPIVFMEDTGGKCIDCQDIKWFNLFYLVLDLLFFFLISLFIVFFCLKKLPTKG
jgi:hypothetical protein